MNRRFLQIALVSTTLLSLAVFAEGCGLQGEGQRCSTLNGNDDCDTGLECRSKNALNTNADICCPLNGGSSTEAACSGVVNGNSTSSSSSSSSSTTTTTTTTTTGAGGAGGTGGAGGAGGAK